MVLTTPHQIDTGDAIKSQLVSFSNALLTANTADYRRVIVVMQGELGIGMFTEAAMHTPMDVTKKALAFANEHKVDCVVSPCFNETSRNIAEFRLYITGRRGRWIYDRFRESPCVALRWQDQADCRTHDL